MAVYEIETETEYSAENVLDENQARKQFDVMIKQMGAKLDQWRCKNEATIVRKDGSGKRNWNIKIKLKVTNSN